MFTFFKSANSLKNASKFFNFFVILSLLLTALGNSVTLAGAAELDESTNRSQKSESASHNSTNNIRSVFARPEARKDSQQISNRTLSDDLSFAI
jgi:hypothetical protein